MDEIPAVYNLETVEQVRALADELRLRITELLTRQAMTVTQVGAALKVSPAKIHYHVRELERVGLLKLVETREKGGILEKYYRAVAWSLNIPGTLLTHLSPDETIAQMSEFLQIITQGYTRVMLHAARTQQFEGEDAPALSLGAAQVWMTNEELKRVLGQIHELLEPYRAARGVAGEREVTFAHVVYEATLSDSGSTPSTAASPGADERSATSEAPERHRRAGRRKEV